MVNQRETAKPNGENPHARQGAQPGPPPAPILLSELTSPAFGEMREQVELVMIPVGAHEQHGPALPVATDTLTAQVLCALAGALLRPRAAVAPAVPWGISWHHLELPGTITLRDETLIAIVEDIVTSLHAGGIDRFLIVNTHGGNNTALQVAADRCHARHGVPVVAAIDGYTLVADAAADILSPEAIGHAGGDESSVVLAVRPELVDREQLGPRERDEALANVQSLVRAARGVLPVAMTSVTASGATGDSSQASGEAGSAILGRAASQLRTIAEEIMDLDVDTFRRS